MSVPQPADVWQYLNANFEIIKSLLVYIIFFLSWW